MHTTEQIQKNQIPAQERISLSNSREAGALQSKIDLDEQEVPGEANALSDLATVLWEMAMVPGRLQQKERLKAVNYYNKVAKKYNQLRGFKVFILAY